jgi:hypothetical protein
VNINRWPGQLLLLVLAFVVPTLIALAVGAANLGTAATVGELTFAATFMFLIVKE